MISNLPAHADDRQLRHAEALCTLLARADVSDVCNWTIRDGGIEGQLSAVYTDPEAHTRIRELAGHLTGGQLITHPARDGAYTAIEAVGTAGGCPVRFWTHLHDRDAMQEAQR